MPIYPDYHIRWDRTGLMPTDALEFWNQYVPGQSGNEVIFDYSGNNRHLACDATGAPVITADQINGQPGWVFDGTSNPLVDNFATDPFTLRHLFILLKVNEATFAADVELISDQVSNAILLADSTTTKWQDTFTGSYYKNDTSYALADRQAPMQVFALLEVVIPDGETIDLLTLNASGDFNGTFMEMAGWSEVLNTFERRRVHLLFNLRYRTHELTGSAIPLYFPSADIVPELATQARVNNRFNDRPLDWQAITEEFEYEDRGKDFNEVADTVPRRWEYGYQNVPKAQKPIFDTFNDVARRANTFSFKDNEQFIWTPVQIEEYQRNHDEHKRWRNDVTFALVGYDSTSTYEAPEIIEEEEVEGTEIILAPIQIDAGRTTGGTVDGWLQDDFAISGTSGLATGVGTPDTTGVVDPAPDAVYSDLHRGETLNTETYHITDLEPNKPHKIRFHACFISGGFRNVGHEWPLPTFRHALFDEIYQTADVGKVKIYEGSMFSDDDGDIGLNFQGYVYSGTGAFCAGLEVIQVPSFELAPLKQVSVANGDAYFEQLTTVGATGPVTHEIRRGDGALPKGMVLTPEGILSGTPIIYRQSQIFTGGDSLTAGLGTAQDLATRWPVQLQLLLGDKFTVTNVATGGSQLSNMATAYTTSVLPNRNTAMAKDIYILWGGRNDIDAGRDPVDIFADIQTLCIAAQAGGFLVIVCTLPYDVTFDATKEAKRSDVNGEIQGSWPGFADALLNLNSLPHIGEFVPVASDADYFYRAFDGVHFHAPGWGIVAEAAKTKVHGLAPNGAAYVPTSDAAFNFTVTAIDSNGSIATKDYTLTVTP